VGGIIWWWYGMVNDEKVMYEDRQPNLPLRPMPTAAGKLPHRAVLLAVGKTQFHRLTSEAVEALGFRRGHSRAVGLDQRLVFAAFNGSAAVRIGAAFDLPGTRPAMLRRTAIAMQHVNLPVALSSFLASDPRHRMVFRTAIQFLLGHPGKLLLPEGTLSPAKAAITCSK
jgi:hypothetical protein